MDCRLSSLLAGSAHYISSGSPGSEPALCCLYWTLLRRAGRLLGGEEFEGLYNKLLMAESPETIVWYKDQLYEYRDMERISCEQCAVGLMVGDVNG